VWIGTTGASCPDIVNECWTWPDGSEFSYTNWNGGEPNDHQEGCEQMHAQGGNARGTTWVVMVSGTLCAVHLWARNSAVLLQIALALSFCLQFYWCMRNT
jgi:hypothetical protein